MDKFELEEEVSPKPVLQKRKTSENPKQNITSKEPSSNDLADELSAERKSKEHKEPTMKLLSHSKKISKQESPSLFDIKPQQYSDRVQPPNNIDNIFSSYHTQGLTSFPQASVEETKIKEHAARTKWKARKIFQALLSKKKFGKSPEKNPTHMNETPAPNKTDKDENIIHVSGTVAQPGMFHQSLELQIGQSSFHELRANSVSARDTLLAHIEENVADLEHMFNPAQQSQSLIVTIKETANRINELRKSQSPENEAEYTRLIEKVKSDLPMLESLFKTSVSEVRSMLKLVPQSNNIRHGSQ